MLNFPTFQTDKKNEANTETLQPTKQNDMLANNNN